MKRLAVDAQKSKRPPNRKLGDSQEKKKSEVRELVGDEDQKPDHEHDNELPHRDRPDYFILNIDKLWDKKLVHLFIGA